MFLVKNTDARFLVTLAVIAFVAALVFLQLSAMTDYVLAANTEVVRVNQETDAKLEKMRRDLMFVKLDAESLRKMSIVQIQTETERIQREALRAPR